MACDITKLLEFIDEAVEEYGISSLGYDMKSIAKEIMEARGNTEAVEMIDATMGNKAKPAADEAASPVVLSNKSSRKKADSLFNESAESLSELDPEIAALGLPEAGNDILSKAIDCIPT